jgi:hypothetical protein
VESGWSISQAADFYRVSWPTAKRWAERYRDQAEAAAAPVTVAAMQDRSSRPLRSPNCTPALVMRKIVHLPWRKRLGPVQIAGKLDMAASTLHAVLVRCRLNRLSHVDRRTGDRSAATSTNTPDPLSTWMRKSSATSPTVADGDSWAAARAAATGPPRRASGVPQCQPRTADGHGLCSLRDR